MHPASRTFKPVRELSDAELRAIIDRAPTNWLLKSSREKDAVYEVERRRIDRIA